MFAMTVLAPVKIGVATREGLTVAEPPLDLDAPITKYVRGFHPSNSFNKPITLRHILAHRSGIVREPSGP